MPFKEKAVVRHRLRPDWGAGRVLVRTEEYLQIDFTAGGLKKLKTSIADEHLESANDAQPKALKFSSEAHSVSASCPSSQNRGWFQRRTPELVLFLRVSYELFVSYCFAP